jgi:hypothetical protein
MFDQGHNRLGVLTDELTIAFEQIVARDGLFYEMRQRTREIAPEYAEFIVWSPNLVGEYAVTDIWDKAWKSVAQVRVRASQKMITAPMW